MNMDLQQRLITYCRENDYESVKKMLREEGLDPLYNNGECLHFAIKNDNLDLFKLLINHSFEYEIEEVRQIVQYVAKRSNVSNNFDEYLSHFLSDF